MANIDRLNMLIRNYNERFPNATVEQLGNYLRRNYPNEYNLFKRIGDVKQNIANPNFTLGEGSALKYQNKPATNLPAKASTGTNIAPYNNFDPIEVGKQQSQLSKNARAKAAYDWMLKNQGTTSGPNVTYKPEVQPTIKNAPVRWGDRFQPPAIRDNTDYTKSSANTKNIKPSKVTPKGAGKLGAAGAILGALTGVPAFFGLGDEGKSFNDKALDVTQGIAGLGSLLTLAPHPLAKGLGWASTALATGIPIARGALSGNQENENPIQQVQSQPIIQQPIQQVVEPAPQVQRVTNTPTEYQLPNINIITQAPKTNGDFYNRADIMQQELGAMTKGAAKNFNRVQAGPTPEQIQAYANIFNLKAEQDKARQSELAQLQKAQQIDNNINTVGNMLNAAANVANSRRGLPVDLVFRDFSGNVIGQMSGDSSNAGQPQQYAQPTQANTIGTQQQMQLREEARQRELANAQEMAKIQDAIALANATGMPINQALGLTGKDILGYNQDVIQRQSDLLGKGIEGSYDIAQEAMEQEGGLAKEGYSQAGQNARTAANIQRDILKTQMDNAAAMERILQQGQNALTLAEYKARTGTTAGYEDYMRAMISATTNPLMPEEYQMAIWNEAMRRQGILPNNTTGGYYQTNGVVDL